MNIDPGNEIILRLGTKDVIRITAPAINSNLEQEILQIRLSLESRQIKLICFSPWKIKNEKKRKKS